MSGDSTAPRIDTAPHQDGPSDYEEEEIPYVASNYELHAMQVSRVVFSAQIFTC